MIRDRRAWERFERRLARERGADHLENQRLLDGMLEEVACLGLLPVSAPLDGLEVAVRIARVVNHVQGAH
jgi:hypothetical protein